ncbi:MAG: SufD family Fe-S cluster assembly protein [Olsenella sp.]|nr:SufD family Fe-S cluster assembly protein [Olsenella sp.]
MADDNATLGAAVADEPRKVTLSHVNTPPAETWNYLRANDITLTVPALSRKGDVYFALPQLFGRIECGMGAKVTEWVTSQAADATYVEVPRNTVRTEPVVVDVDADAGQVADTGVMIREGAEATVVVVAHGGGSEAATSAALTRIVCEKRAKLHLFEVLALPDAETHLESVGIVADDDATIEVRQYLLGGATQAVGLTADLAGDRARIRLQTRYLGRGTDVLDINHVVRQRGENSRAHVDESGVLADAAHKSLRATIDLVHGAKGAKGDEAETVLVTGDDVVNKTMPVILCDEDDVQGNHGATIGSIGGEQLQYLRDRGLSEEEANDLFVRALFDDAVISSPTASARRAVLDRAAAVLGQEVALDLAEGLELECADTEGEA